jgi:hypothetical protein
MVQVVSSWLIEHLPPEAGPYLVWAAGHYDTARSLALLVAVAWLLATALAVRALWGWLR